MTSPLYTAQQAGQQSGYDAIRARLQQAASGQQQAPNFIAQQQALEQARYGVDNTTPKPEWQNQLQQRQQQQAQIQQAIPTPTAASAQSQGYWANRLQTTDQLGQIANAGVQGWQNTVQRQKAQAAADASMKAMQDATANLQSQYQQYTQNANAQLGQLTQNADGTYQTGTSSDGTNLKAGDYIFGNAGDNTVAAEARKAGWAEQDIPMVVAISHAESSQNNDITHSNPDGSTDMGLMQINTIHRNDPIIQKQYPNFFSGGYKDPIANLAVALQIYKDAGNSFEPWVTFQNGGQQLIKDTGVTYRVATTADVKTATPQSQPLSVGSVTVGGTTIQTGAVSTLRKTVVQDAFQVALNNIPYVYAGDSLTQGVDCSGLVQQVYKLVGINTPRTSTEDSHPENYTTGMKTHGYRVSNINQLQAGDLICYKYSGTADDVHHVVIYNGDGTITEAPHTGVNIRRRTLTSKDFNSGNMIFVHLVLPGDK